MLKIKSEKQFLLETKKAEKNPEKFWEKMAESFIWKKKWKKVLDWNFTEPNVKWFLDGKLNITENCLDRHLEKNKNKTAIIWEANDPNTKSKKITYAELSEMVNQFANVLKKHNVKKGDTVCIYMPMIVEVVVAMLACARVGAIHSVVFAGFSHGSLADRIKDLDCKFLITADGYMRGEKPIYLKKTVDEALLNIPNVKTVIVYKHTNFEIEMKPKRDLFWHDEIKNQTKKFKAEVMGSEDKLFVLYTSGSTGKPKGIVHTVGGYMVYALYTFLNIFQYKPKDVYWCTADVGWITGHTYLVYGPLLAGATILMFEGVPTYPDATRYWEIIDKHKVNIFYTSPTAIRSLQTYGTKILKKFKLSSLKVLGTVGEPINKSAWNWYYKNIGKNKCAIVDTWWQTETGGIMISTLAGVTSSKPTFAGKPLPGIFPEILNDEGKILTGATSGNLCFKFPWPGIHRTIYGNHERCLETYFSKFPNYYFSGDGCKRDKQGNFRITGRVDDVLKVSGHLLGTGELEDAINKHEHVVESAVVGFPHKIKGQGIYAFIITTSEKNIRPDFEKEVIDVVRKNYGAIGKPDKIHIVKNLPKTRSGKIMRRILRKIAEEDFTNFGDTSTLLDPKVVEEIISSLRK